MIRRTLLLFWLCLVAAQFWPVLGHATEKPLVYFGINLRYSPRTMYLRYQPLMDYLTANTPYRFELRISHDYRSALDDFKEGRVAIASLGDGAFVDAMIRYGAVPIVKPLDRHGRPFLRAAVVTPRGGDVSTLADLSGKTFAFGFSHSLTGNLLPRLMLQQAGVEVADLKYQVSLKNHDAVTKAILRGIYDAGSVKESFATKYQQRGLRVLAYSSPIPSVPLLVHPGSPPLMRRTVAAALTRLDPRNPAHVTILSPWDDEFRYGFAHASFEDYRGVIRMFKAVPNGCGLRCHK